MPRIVGPQGTVGVAAALSATLAAGNTTGATDIIVSSGAVIRGTDAATGLNFRARAGSSSGANINGGQAEFLGGDAGAGNAVGGRAIISSGNGFGNLAGGATAVSGGTGGATGAGGDAALNGGNAGGGTAVGGEALVTAGPGGSGGGIGADARIRGGLGGTAAASGGGIRFETAPAGTGTTRVVRGMFKPLGTLNLGDNTLSSTFSGDGGATLALNAYRGGDCQILIGTWSNTAGDAPFLNFQRGGGTPATPAAVPANSIMGYVQFAGASTAAARVTGARITVTATALWTGTSAPTQIAISTCAVGSVTLVDHLTVGPDGAITFVTLSGQTVTVNDASNTAFTGSAAGATSLVGAINSVGGRGASTSVFGGAGLTTTTAVPVGALATNGQAIEVTAWGSGVNTETLGVTVFGTSVLSAVASATSAYQANITIIRTGAASVDVIASFVGQAAPTRTTVAAVSGNIVTTAGTTGVARCQTQVGIL